MGWRYAVALLLSTISAPAPAAIIAVTPANYASSLAAAEPGDILTAAVGTYPAARLANKVFSPAATLRAPEGAVFGRLTLSAVDGFDIVGGTFAGEAADGHVPNGLFGINVDHSRNLSFDRPLFVGLQSGLNLVTSSTVTITNFECRAMVADCIDVSSSQNLKIAGGLVHGGLPGPGAHPDGIQLDSPAGTPPLANIEISGVWCVGRTQCIDTFANKVPATAINVHDNQGDVSMPAFADLTVGGCSGCNLVNNRVEASRGAAYIANITPRAAGGNFDGTVAGNVVSARPVALPQ